MKIGFSGQLLKILAAWLPRIGLENPREPSETGGTFEGEFGGQKSPRKTRLGAKTSLMILCFPDIFFDHSFFQLIYVSQILEMSSEQYQHLLLPNDDVP